MTRGKAKLLRQLVESLAIALDKVRYRGKNYICTADANVYATDVYGWEESA